MPKYYQDKICGYYLYFTSFYNGSVVKTKI